MTPYLDFDLHIAPTQTAGRYRAHLQQSPAGEATAEFDLSAAYRGAPSDPRRFGESLFTTVFCGQVRDCLFGSLTRAELAAHGLRIRLHLDNDPLLTDLSWEYLCAPPPYDFFALSTRTPLVRYLELGQGVAPLRVALPLRILVVMAAPNDLTPRLDVAQEWQRLQNALTPLVSRGQVILELLTTPTAAALQQRLRQSETPIHILHVVSHATTGVLLLEDDEGRARPIAAEPLAVLLQDQPMLRLVFLNVCEGARTPQGDPTAGLAQAMVRKALPAVIAMQYPITDQAAIELAHGFYHTLAAGAPVDAALAEARKVLYIRAELIEWGTPVLFSRSPDNRLFDWPQLPAPHAVAAEPALGEEPATVLIEAGAFTQGDPRAVSGSPWQAHRYTLAAYCIGKYPVTNAEYARFVAQHPERRPEHVGWSYIDPPPARLNHPVVGISWHDAVAYCAWLSLQTGRRYRLPSEAEWEKAARGDQDTRLYPWGDELTPGHCNYAGTGTTPVDNYPAGVSPFGCYDMVGNVSEWTSTIWGNKAGQPQFVYPYRNDGRDRLDVRGQPLRIHRGGSYDDTIAQLGCSARGKYRPDARLPNTGFRVVLEL
jgi:formylglycine-generating enzyme required for sulfatase activity